MTDVAPRLDDPFGVLRRVMSPRVRAAPGEQCDMCGEKISQEHSHVANLVGRRLMCTCRGCFLLFNEPGAGGTRMRAVPERYLVADDFSFTQVQWDDLAIPVDLVFLFHQSDIDTGDVPGKDAKAKAMDVEATDAVATDAEATDAEATDSAAEGVAPAVKKPSLVACYPSPAGATESELELSTWEEIAAANPSIADMADDVEAVLLRRRGPGDFTCFIVPIDACYELVGLVRQYWTGFQGGPEVWKHIDEFFAQLYRRAGRPLPEA